MTLAHVNKYYLESNLTAASPSSRRDSLYAGLQVHALSVSDSVAKVMPTLGSCSPAPAMGRVDIDLATCTAARQQSTIIWLQADATLKALLPKESVNKDQHGTAFECIAQRVLRACEIHEATSTPYFAGALPMSPNLRIRGPPGADQQKMTNISQIHESSAYFLANYHAFAS